MKKIGFFLVGVCLALSVSAQIWQPANGGTWNNTASWSPATVPDSATAQVFVTNNFTASPVPLTLDRASAFTVNKISYNDTTTPFVSCTISAGSPAGSLAFGGTTPTVDTPAASGNGADLTITAPVDVTSGLTKTGARNVYLNGVVTGFGPNVYNNVNAGMLAIGTATPIDWTVINKTAGSGTLRLDALTTMTVPATFSVGVGEVQLNPASGTFSFNAAGFTKTGSGALRFVKPAAGPGGSTTFTISGGNLCLSDTLSGFASGTIASGGTLQPNAGITYTNIPLSLTGTGASGALGALYFRSGGSTTVTWPGAITLGSGGATIASYGIAYNTTLSGAIGGSGPLTIQAQGGNSTSHTATFILGAANNYSGNTTLNNADGIISLTVKLGVTNALPVGTVLTLTDAAGSGKNVFLDLNGFSQTLAGLTTGGTATNKSVRNSSATAAALTLNNSGSVTYGGILGGPSANNLSLIKQGGGTLTLTGSNTYSGATSVNGGTLLVNNTTGSGTGTSNVTVNSGGTLGGSGTILGDVIVNSNGTSSVSGVIQGAVTVNSGATLSGTGVIQGAVSVAAGATIQPGGSAAVGTMTLTNSLTLNGSALTFDLPSSGANDLISLGGVLTLNGASTLALNLLNGTLPAGTYTLMTYAATNGLGSLSFDRVYRNAALNVGATSVTLTVTGIGVGPSLTWVGGTGNPWDINTSSFWTNGATVDVFYNLDNVTFNDSGSASPAINLTTNVQPNSIIVTNALKAYTFSGAGSIAGTGTLAKQGTNTLTLSLANTFSGLTTVSGGKLAYGANDAIGSGAVTVSGAGAVLAIGTYTDTVGTVTLDNGGQITGTSGTLSTTATFELKNGTVSAILAGSGALNVTTPATVTLAGSNTYSGVTTVGVNGVSNSILSVNNNLALGSTAAGTLVNGGTALVENRVVLANGITVTDETITLDSGASYRAGLHLGNVAAGTWDGNIVLAGSGGTYLSNEGGGTFTVGGSAAKTITGSPAGALSFRGGSGLIVVNSRFNIGSTQINRDDAGTVMINSTSNVWGNTALLQGTLKLGVSEALPATTTLTVGKTAVADAIFDLNGKNQTIAGLAEAHTTTGTQKIRSSTPTTLIVSNTAANTFGTTNSTIEGAVTIVKSGSGTLTLTGTNTYSGATIVSNGTLVVSSTGMLGNSTNITVAAGTLTLQNSSCITNTATVRIASGGGAKVSLAAGVNQTVNYLYYDDKQKSTGTYGATGSGASKINDEHFAGSGVLTVLHGSGGTLLRLL